MSSISVKFQGMFFAAGQNVYGSIILNAEKPLDMKSFKLDLLMNVSGSWSSGCCTDTNTGASLKGDTQMIIEVNEVYSVGVHEIPFAYPLPADLPASSEQTIKSASATYSYNLKVEGIRSSTFSFNPKAVVPLLVTDNVSLPIVSTQISKNKKARTCCCIPKGESSIDAQVSNTNLVIGRDQTIDIVVNFKNNTVYEMTSFMAHVQYDLFMRESSWALIWKDRTESVSGWKIASSVVVPMSLKPGETVENFVIHCPMPNEAWRTFTHRRVRTSAQLAVSADFIDGKISPIMVSCPVTVHQLL